MPLLSTEMLSVATSKFSVNVGQLAVTFLEVFKARLDGAVRNLV